jgi:hypothetical protein
MKKLELSDQRICKFYEDNPSINIETVNLFIIDIFDKVLINKENTSITDNKNSSSINTFIDNFEKKSSAMLQNVQQPIYSFICASEERIISNLNLINNGNNIIQCTQTKFMSDLSDVLQKFNQDNTKYNNKNLQGVLTKMYNSAEVHNPNKIPNSNGLILLKRNRKYNILIDNKNSEENVTNDEVQTYLASIDEQNCNGIFISQQSGISGKKNYQIDMHNNNIIVYVHHGQYEPSKIEAAVDIIDQLSSKMRQFKHQTEEDCTIPKEILDTINTEYQLFLSQKNAVVDVFKESQKKVLSQIDEIRFPTLDKYLATKYSAPIQKPGLKCDLCKSFSANNLKALAAHKRGCIRKQTPLNVALPR